MQYARILCIPNCFYPSLDFFRSWKDLGKKPQLWLVVLAFAVPGAQYGFQSVMAIQFKHFGVTDTDIGSISFVAVTCQACGVTLVGLSMDRFRRRLKPVALAFLVASFLAYLWLALITFDVIAYRKWMLYTSFVMVSG